MPSHNRIFKVRMLFAADCGCHGRENVLSFSQDTSESYAIIVAALFGSCFILFLVISFYNRHNVNAFLAMDVDLAPLSKSKNLLKLLKWYGISSGCVVFAAALITIPWFLQSGDSTSGISTAFG